MVSTPFPRALCFALVCVSATAQLTPIWQGFDYQWMRKVVGLETPHRLGTVASYFTDADNDSSVAHMTLHPGVDGDYSNPSTLYTCLDASSSVGIASTVATISFNQSITTSPEGIESADTTANGQAHLTLPTGFTSDDDRIVVLGGFAIDMACYSVDGSVCNSNGMWATNLRLSVGACSPGDASSQLVCDVSARIARGWTPTHGGGKPLSTYMSFDVSLNVTAVVSTPGITLTALHSVSESSNIFAGPARGVVNTTNTDPGSSLLVGLSGFEFQLLETKAYKNLGRYLEHLTFHVGAEGHNGLFYEANFQAPKLTTYPSDITYNMNISSMVLPHFVRPTAATASVAGKICENDVPLFYCKNIDYPESLSTTVPFKCQV